MIQCNGTLHFVAQPENFFTHSRDLCGLRPLYYTGSVEYGYLLLDAAAVEWSLPLLRPKRQWITFQSDCSVCVLESPAMNDPDGNFGTGSSHLPSRASSLSAGCTWLVLGILCWILYSFSMTRLCLREQRGEKIEIIARIKITHVPKIRRNGSFSRQAASHPQLYSRLSNILVFNV